MPPDSLTDEQEYEMVYSAKWLNTMFVFVLILGIPHLFMSFYAIVMLSSYFLASLCMSEYQLDRKFKVVDPVKIWKVIDEGLFSLMEHDNDADNDDFHALETRSDAERRIACDQLSEKCYDALRTDTMLMIRDGFIAGNTTSFQSPTEENTYSRLGTP